ncbi:MAG: hypothetical protein ACK4GL_06270 [Flavobacteriales bacterium]
MQILSEKRIIWIFRIVMAGILTALLISTELWMTERNFPLIPITGKFIPLPYPIDYILFCGMIVLPLLLLIYYDNKPLLIGLAVLFGLLLMADQMRWQNFNMYYFFIVITYVFLKKEPEKLLNVVRLSLVAYMVWSGIQNINHIYFTNVFPWLFEPFTRKFLPQAAISYFNYIGYLFPFLQIFAGVGLLFAQTRRASMWIGIGILGILFLSLSPLGHNWNKIQLPYYLVLICHLFFAFYESEFNFKKIFNPGKSPFYAFALVIFIILPSFNLVGLYDDGLSYKEFSGKGLYCKVYFDDEIAENLPEVLKQYTFKIDENKNYFDVFYWSLYALKVPPYAERRVFLALDDYFCQFQQKEQCSVRISIYDYNNPEQEF